MDIKKAIIAALSLWEGADDPNTNREYVRGQAETIARIMQAGGWDIPSVGVTDALLAAAREVARGGNTLVHAENVYQVVCG